MLKKIYEELMQFDTSRLDENAATKIKVCSKVYGKLLQENAITVLFNYREHANRLFGLVLEVTDSIEHFTIE